MLRRPRSLVLRALLTAALGVAVASTHAGRPLDPVEAQADKIRRYAQDASEQRQREAAIRTLGNLGGQAAADALLPLAGDPFEHIREHAIRAWAAMTKGAKAAESRAWLEKQLVANRDPMARRAIARALGFTSDGASPEAILAALEKEDDAVVIEALADGCGPAGPTPAVADKFAGTLRHKDGHAVFSAAQAAAASKSDAARDALVVALAHKQPMARAGAVLGLQRLNRLPASAVEAILSDPADEPRIALAETLELRTAALSPWVTVGAPALKTLLASSAWRVRAAAIDAAVRLWEPSAIPLLVERLRQEDGRLRQDLATALATITGKGIAADADQWAAWWSAAKDTFSPGPRPSPDRWGRIRRPVETPAGDETRTVAFFAVPVDSKRVAFLFDVSGTMRDPAPDGTGGGTKLDLARREFARTLGLVAPDVSFDLFVHRYLTGFPPRPTMTRALGKLAPATDAARRQANEWVAKEQVKGWGDFYDALALAAVEDVDTIYFLSDGRPSRGPYVDRDRIVLEFAKRNRWRRVVVHTVLIGEKSGREFMEDLAAATGGRFSDGNKPAAGR